MMNPCYDNYDHPFQSKNHFNKWNHQPNQEFHRFFIHTFQVPFFTMKSRNEPSGGSRSICTRWVGGCFDTRGQGNVGRASTEFLEVLGIRRSRIVIQAGVKPRRPAAIHGELRNCIETVCCNDIFLTENATNLHHCSGCQVSKMPGSLRSNIEAPGRRMEQLHGHHWECQRYRIYMNLLVVGKIECHMSSPPGLQYRVVFLFSGNWRFPVSTPAFPTTGGVHTCL